MKLNSLVIKGFRSFSTNAETVDLTTSNYIALVGPNGAGKSTLLQALRWLAGDSRLDDSDIEPTDFHKCDPSSGFTLELRFAELPTLGDSFNKFHSVARTSIVAKQYERTEAKGAIRLVQTVLDSAGTPIRLHQTTPLAKGKELSEEEKLGRQSARPAMISDLRGQVPTFFLDPTNYQFHLSMRRGSLLAEVARSISDDLSRDSAEVEFRGSKVKRSEAISVLSEELSGLLQTERAKPILDETSKFLQSQLGLSEHSASFLLSIPSGPELIKRLSLLMQDGPSMPGIPLENCGRGYAALAIVGLFKALRLAKTNAALILVEEPESFLTPSAKSAFASELRQLAEAGHQVIVVTHSPEFVDPLKPWEVVRLSRKDQVTTIHQWPMDKRSPGIGPITKFIEPNLGRLLFSRRVVFVEGPDDLVALRASLDIFNLELGSLGLEIIQLTGKGNGRVFHEYCKAFEIEHVFLVDEDAEGQYTNLPAFFLQPDDLEGSLNTKKMSPSSFNTAHVFETVRKAKSAAELKTLYPSFFEAVVATLQALSVSTPDFEFDVVH